MSARTAARAAWSIAGIGGLVLALGWVLALRNHDLLDLTGDYMPDHFIYFGVATVGAVVASRRHDSPIGWILLGAALVDALRGTSAEYAIHGLGARPVGAGTTWAGWVANLVLILAFPSGAIAFFLLLFPDGHLPSRGWRFLPWLAAGVTALFLAGVSIDSTPISLAEGLPALRNPTGIRGLLLQQSPFGWLVYLAALGVFALAATSVVVRYRRSRGDQRQQLKWFAYATGLLLPAVLATYPWPWASTASNVVAIVGFGFAVPAAVGVAILKYRLYDIDRLINRTLVYGLLSVLLGGCYAALVLGLGQRLGGVGGHPPPWTVAAATLAVAALFGPLRRRIQGTVDRRFNRRRYDAAKTVAAFNARLRDEVDLDTLTAELVRVVDKTIQPTTVSLWLRAGPIPERRSRAPG